MGKHLGLSVCCYIYIISVNSKKIECLSHIIQVPKEIRGKFTTYNDGKVGVRCISLCCPDDELQNEVLVESDVGERVGRKTG